MKSLSYYSVIVVVLISMLFFSCENFLTEPPRGSLSEDLLAGKEQGPEKLLMGVYGSLDGMAGVDFGASGDVSNWPYGSLAGGDVHKGSFSGDQPPMNTIARTSTQPTNGYLDNKWRALYEGVNRANDVIKVVSKTENISEETKNRILGEARFLRGHFYFELTKLFFRVPWIDESTNEFNQPNDSRVWSEIEEDFVFAMNNLPEVQLDVGRANRWAAQSYLAKTFVYQEKWQEAKELFDDIISNGVNSNGVPYELVDFHHNFNANTENNSETVFAVQNNGPDGTGGNRNAWAGVDWGYPHNSPFSCCGFMQPTLELVNSYQTDSNTGLPLTPDEYNSSPVEHDLGVGSEEEFVPHEGSLDPRLDWTVGRRGVPYHDWGPFPGQRWTRDQSYGGPYHAKKHVYLQANREEHSTASRGTAVNYNIIRFADVLLMAAEAEIELGNLNAARQYVNQIRERAANSNWVNNDLNREFAADIVESESEMLNLDVRAGDWVVREDRNSTFVLLKGDPSNIDNWNEYKNSAENYNVEPYPAGHSSFQSPTSARDAVHFERKLELANEGHRFFDLVRWEEAEEKLNAYYDFEGTFFSDVRGAVFVPPRDRYYPIPQRQIDLSVRDGKPLLQQNPGY